MTEVALATIPAQDLSKMNKKQLRAWVRTQDKDRLVDLLKAGANFAHSLLENEVLLALIGLGTVNWMLQREHPGWVEDSEGNILYELGPKYPWLSPAQAGAMTLGVIGIALAKSGAVENIGDAVGKMRGD